VAGELVEAIRSRDEERMRALVEAHPACAEERDAGGVSALMLTYYYGVDGAAVRAARRAPLDVFEAATVGDLERLGELLDADPALARARSADDTTALHFAAFFKQPDAARVLLAYGADPHAVSPTFGNVTPLHSAATAGNTATVRALLAAGADANARQDGGYVPIHAAASNGDAEMVDELLASGADPGAANDDGRVAADFAADNGHHTLAVRLRGDQE
jgi:ankyrin repeat protein